ncbi:MAG: VOC family protein [Rhodobacter sp.]|nr:VOC family protein [Rhodobacter sp.]
MDLNPYLTFPGTCEDALNFYAEVFGGQVEMLQKVKDSPMAAEMPAAAQDQVIHGRVRIGERLIMASDHLQGDYTPPAGMQVQTAFDDVEKASRVFSRLAKNGETVMAFGPTFWAAGFGMCRDRYGIPWMVNCDQPPGG